MPLVAKVNSQGNNLIYSGFLGGDDRDEGNGIAVDSVGNVYVIGSTESARPGFPATVGPHLTWMGGWEIFVAKVNSAGVGLVYAGDIGGGEDDGGQAIAIDGQGNAYIAGSTYGLLFTQTRSDLTPNGGRDALVGKINAAGSAVIYLGNIGGGGSDGANGIAIDPRGNAYVTGFANSTQTDCPVGFPITVGPDLTFNGDDEAFVAKVNAAGTALIYSGYIGRSGYDSGSTIAVDAIGNVYIVGQTTSSALSFPVKVGPDLSYNGDGYDAFVAKLGTAMPTVVFRDSSSRIRLLTRYATPQLFNAGGYSPVIPRRPRQPPETR